MKYVALKDVCKINMGQSPDSSSYNENGEGIPFFQGNADFGERYPVTRVWCNAPTKIAQSEDILISVRAPIGALNYSKEKCCIGRGLAAITPDKSKVSLEFVYWFLKGKNAELKSKGTGSTFKAISKKILEEILIPDVGFDKQHEYAQMLEKIYVIIQTRKQGLQKLDELIQSRFVEMFGDIITGKYNYKIRKLGDVAFIGSSHRVFTTEFVESGIPFYRGTEIGELANGIEPSEPYYISEEHYNKLTKDNTKPRIGDLLMPSICNKGQIWMVDTDRPFYYKDGRVLCISPNRDIEGCSDRTIQYYRVTIEHMLKRITIPLRQIATEDIRQYLIDYQKINNCGKVTIDNIRRNLSSFFSWLEEEDHILKSPVKRIHKIKTKTVVKEVISDESIEILRDNCKEKRDLAIIDLLFSTGMRVGELVNLDIADIDFNERECIVYGN